MYEVKTNTEELLCWLKNQINSMHILFYLRRFFSLSPSLCVLLLPLIKIASSLGSSREKAGHRWMKRTDSLITFQNMRYDHEKFCLLNRMQWIVFSRAHTHKSGVKRSSLFSFSFSSSCSNKLFFLSFSWHSSSNSPEANTMSKPSGSSETK